LGAALQADGETRSRFRGLKHQKEKRSMDHFAGLDVSVKETSVCIVDDTGKIIREVKVASFEAYAMNVENVKAWCAANPGELVMTGLQRATGQ
jgi:hypothetical protein